MSAQGTERDSARPSSSTGYGAMAPADTRPNGVVPARVEPRSMTSSVVQDGDQNPNLHDPAPPPLRQQDSDTTASTELRPDVAEPSYEEPHRNANVITLGTQQTPATPGRSTSDVPVQTPRQSTSSVRVHEFFSAESATSLGEERNVRWTARFTEFMRIAANRGASGLDRVMDNLGMVVGQNTGQPFVMDTSTSFRYADQMNVSPPEDLPPRPQVIPTSW